MKKGKVHILGSGTSMGVPMAGCDCRVCRSENPRDKRLRTSAFLDLDGLKLLIDTSIDYRQQMIRAGIGNIDAVLYTHHHVDHILGMDDLRSFNILNRKVIPIYGMAETMKNIKRVFAYAFPDDPNLHGIPMLKIHLIDETPFTINGITITPIPLYHGKMPILGFRIGDFAYCTDVSRIPERAYPLLKNVKTLILDALRYKPHPTHFTIDEAVAEAAKIGAQKTYLTHISHKVLHQEAEENLPPEVRLAYDGLALEVQYQVAED